MTRATGRFGPKGLAHILNAELGGGGSSQGVGLDWGLVEEIHGPTITDTTLYANAAAGPTFSTTLAAPIVLPGQNTYPPPQVIETVAAPSVGMYVFIDYSSPYLVTAVTGSGPYTVTLATSLSTAGTGNYAEIQVTSQWVETNGPCLVNDFVVIGSAFSTTLSANAPAGATSISTVAEPEIGMLLKVGGNTGTGFTVASVSGTGPYTVTFASGAPPTPTPLPTAEPSGTAVTENIPVSQVLGVSGSSAPYTVTLAQPLPAAQASGSPVVAKATLDLHLNGSQAMANAAAFLHVGIRYLSTYSPTVGDVVPVLRGPGRAKSDRIVLGKPA